MNTPTDYLCKICRKPGVAYYDPQCPINDVESWKAALTCKHCYKFRDDYMRMKRDCERRCIGLITMRQTIRDEQTRRAAESKIRESLFNITRKISRLCSDYYLVQDMWDEEMVAILLDKPESCNGSVNMFRIGYAKQSNRKTYAF